MHIGFLIMNIKNAGGTERVTSIIANELVRKGYRVSIISCNGGEKCAFELDSMIKLFSLHGENEKNFFRRKAGCYKRLKKIVKTESIDIMIAVDTALYIYILPLQIKKYCRGIAWEHFNYYIADSRLAGASKKIAARFSDCLVVLSKKDLQNYQGHIRKINNIKCIYNPIAPMHGEKTDVRQKCVVSIGRLAEQKGFDRLIDIWELIEPKEKEWKLNIYGEGELREQLQERINRKNLKNITLCGFAENVEEKYCEGSVFALTSRYEGYGLVLLEAQQKGLPCISFDCKEGPAEIIRDRVNGFVIVDGNINQYAEKLLLLMNDENMRERFSKYTDMDHEKYKIENIISQWETLFKNLNKK